MNQESLLTLCDYNAQANMQVLGKAALLSQDELTRESSPSHGTARNLLIHVLGGERFFLSTVQGRAFVPDFEQLATVDEICAYWAVVSREMHDFIAGLDDGGVARDFSIPFSETLTYHFPVWQWFVQLFAHSIHHRGELSIVISQLGHPLPDLDLLLYWIKQTGQPPLA